MPQRRRDLSALPRWAQYAVALAVMGAVAFAGWYVGRDDPTPAWIKDYLIPGLGWLGLVLIILAVFGRTRR